MYRTPTEMIAFTIHPIHRSGKGHYLQTNRVKHTSTDLALLKSLQVMSCFGGTCQEKGKKGRLLLPLTQNLYWEPTDRWLVTSSQLLISRHVFSLPNSIHSATALPTVVSQCHESRFHIQASQPGGVFTGQPCRPRPHGVTADLDQPWKLRGRSTRPIQLNQYKLKGSNRSTGARQE